MTRILIKQIHYRADQRSELDPAFEPFDNSRPAMPGRFETGVFISEFPHIDFDQVDYVGYLSWKFNQKTHLSGRRFIEFIKANPGYDVYFINPFPEAEVFRSVWEQGEVFHPGLHTLVA